MTPRLSDALSRAHALLDRLYWRSIVKDLAWRFGYTIHRIDPVDRSDGQRENPYADQVRIARFAASNRPLIVFDVGANIGQTVQKYREVSADAMIHSFEPLPKAFRQLKVVADNDGRTRANPFALYSSVGRREFLSNRGGANQTSSFLPPARDVGYSYPEHLFELYERIEVETQTVDAYCLEHGITNIDILKADVQGTELEVFKGAEQMLARGAVAVAYVEILFAPVYENNPLYHEAATFMEQHGMDLFRIYLMNHGTAGRHVGGDAVFVERKLLRRFLEARSQEHAERMRIEKHAAIG